MATSATSASIFGLAGLQLSEAEKVFFRQADPWGFIIFARNVQSPEQLRKLTDSLRELTGRSHLPLLIDQEGGRVARLKPPRWRSSPAGARFGEMFRQDSGKALEAVRLNSRLMGQELRQVGINVNCLPVLDVPVAGSHNVIGDRAYSDDPQAVAALGREAAKGLLEAGILPVIKHIPGHGRSIADSHKTLPRVTSTLGQLTASDFIPFKALAHMPLAMTAHIVYETLDPKRPATASPIIIEQIIRGAIGFQGLLMSDDLSMNALFGSFEQRTLDCLAAGCDVVLHCNAEMSEMEAVAGACPTLQGEARDRADRASALLETRHERLDEEEAEEAIVARLAQLLAGDVA